jgi:hypothetical protein
VSYGFVLRTYADIDHVSPLMWKLLDAGEEVHAIVSPGYDPRNDHRLRFIARYPGFHLHEVWPKDGPAWRGRLRSTIPWAMRFLSRHDVRVVSVEWGYGLAPGYDDLRRPAGWLAVARSFARSLKRAKDPDPQQVRTNFIVAARLLHRASACLPHGLSVKLDLAPNRETMKKVEAGTLDYSDRNRFTAYVLNTEHHRRFHIDHMHGDPNVMQTWGAMRWSPEWFEINRRLAPVYEWPAEDAQRLKVVLMAPKWHNRVRVDAAVEMVKALQELPFASVAIKDHPRLKPEDNPLRKDPGVDWTHLHEVNKIDSVSLIRAADVVIDAGSSIGLEALMQGKVLINPAYVHELRTLFDDIPGTCVRPTSTDELVAYLHEHAAGRPFQAPAEAKRELWRRAVYGERDEPYDVIETYYQRFRELSEHAAAGAR